MIVDHLSDQDVVPLVDPLTGLTSRLGLEAWLTAVDAGALAPGQSISVIALAISRFGNVNVSVGPELGDKIIAAVAKRLQKIVKDAALIARTHGDHFCLLFQSDVDLNEQIELLQDFTQRPLAIRGEVIVLSIRMGIASMGPLVKSAPALLHAAEVALHRAKREGLRRCFYRSEMESDAKAAHRLENDLRVSLVTRHVELHKAISNEEFLLLYQPIIDVRKRRVHAVEALLRWNHPTRGLVSPAQFIPMAEQIQVMDVLGNWVLRRACLDAMSLPGNADGTRLGVSVNVSPTQFLEPRMVLETTRQALRESQLDPALLKLEITESAALGSDKLACLAELRELGCKIALDDFGTGYSSLTQLNVMALDYIKLDQSFVSALGGEDADSDQRSDRMTRAVLSIAEALGLTPIIEGVETAEQRDRLLRHGAGLMQGYYFAKPLPLQQAHAYINGFNETA